MAATTPPRVRETAEAQARPASARDCCLSIRDAEAQAAVETWSQMLFVWRCTTARRVRPPVRRGTIALILAPARGGRSSRRSMSGPAMPASHDCSTASASSRSRTRFRVRDVPPGVAPRGLPIPGTRARVGPGVSSFAANDELEAKVRGAERRLLHRRSTGAASLWKVSRSSST